MKGEMREEEILSVMLFYDSPIINFIALYFAT